MVKSNLKYRTQQQLTYKDADDNFDALMYYSGTWSVSVEYDINEVVTHGGTAWVCQVKNTGVDPQGATTEWTRLVIADNPTNP